MATSPCAHVGGAFYVFLSHTSPKTFFITAPQSQQEPGHAGAMQEAKGLHTHLAGISPSKGHPECDRY